ncbi:hypothetical protein D6783_02840 [Candidatus Woesearchaeota archaeon]|nr:MAG: hypothetical protein D6783_02840 [Candidatus Woesearchaeota archaeon]
MVVPYYETVDDNGIQRDEFDWDAALVGVLQEYMGQSAAAKNKAKEVLGSLVEYPKHGHGKVYSCERLGIDKQTALDEIITASELGKRIQADEQLVGELQRLLGIDVKEEWNPSLRFI